MSCVPLSWAAREEKETFGRPLVPDWMLHYSKALAYNLSGDAPPQEIKLPKSTREDWATMPEPIWFDVGSVGGNMLEAMPEAAEGAGGDNWLEAEKVLQKYIMIFSLKVWVPNKLLEPEEEDERLIYTSQTAKNGGKDKRIKKKWGRWKRKRFRR